MRSLVSDSSSQSIFDHAVRKEWGVAILAWEDGAKRGYLFADGEERTMASAFDQLMRRVEQPTAEQVAASQRLRQKLAARKSAHASAGQVGPTFLQQLSRLQETYAAGLSDPKWAADLRGEGPEGRIAGHRAPMIQEAQEELSRTAFDALLSTHSYGQLWELVTTALSHTDLVPASQLKKPRLANNEQQRALAVAARELLYGAATYDQRFDRYVAALGALGEPARWEMSTALSALVHPTQHVCVHPATFRRQLKLTAGSTAPARPSAAGYKRMLAVARFISTKLAEQGQTPRDLFDVYDFIRITCSAPRVVTTKKITKAMAATSQ